MELIQAYEKALATKSDIQAHLPKLKALAEQYGTVLECGFRHGTSAIALLAGGATVTSIDVEDCEEARAKVEALAPESFTFKKADSLKFKPKQVGLVFLDTLHTYEHLSAELAKYSKYAKCIAMHDTDAKWNKKARTYNAVLDFLKANNDWRLQSHSEECHGFTIIVKA